MRDVGTNSNLNKVYLKKVLQIRGSIILITLLVVAFIQYVIYPITDGAYFVFILILIIAKGLDALCETFYMIYLSLKMYKKYSLIKILHALFAILFVAISCILKYAITVTYLLILCSSLLFFVVNIYFFVKYKNEINNTPSPVMVNNTGIKTPESITFKYLAKESWSLLLSVVFFQIGSRVNTLIIFGIIGSVSLGVYSSSYMLITCFTAAAPFMGIVLFPILNRNFLEDPNKLSKFILKIIPLIFFVGVAATLVCYLSIPLAIKLMKNMPDYASKIFAIMIWVIPFNYVIGIINSIFIIIKKQSVGMIVTLIIMLVNMALVYVGALLYKLNGVAIASVIGSFFQVALFIVVYLFVNKKNIINKNY
jgi:O-antigen/teichoic acid export membrane protein